MKASKILLTTGMMTASFIMMPAASAATIFNVDFDKDSIGGKPDIHQPAYASPTVNTKPTSATGNFNQSTGKNIGVANVHVMDESTAGQFSGFGLDHFIVYTQNMTKGSAQGATYYEPNSADKVSSGVMTSSFDFQFTQGPDTERNNKGNFTVSIEDSDFNDIGTLTIALFRGINGEGTMSLSRGGDSYSIGNMELLPDVSYTITSILILDGANSTLNFMINDTLLDNAHGAHVNPTSFGRFRLRDLGTEANNYVAVDNVQIKIDPVPEPASGMLMLAAGGLLLKRKRR